jgi:hypothetical protein
MADSEPEGPIMGIDRAFFKFDRASPKFMIDQLHHVGCMSRARVAIRLWELGSGLPLEQVRDFLEETFSPSLRCASPARLVPAERTVLMARRCQAFRIADPGRLGARRSRSPASEVGRIARILEGGANTEDRRAVMLSGLGLQGLLASALGHGAFRPNTIDILFTAVLPGTWDPDECRYHARSLLCGFPSIVSTSGAVEGPARPRGYYVAKMMGLNDEEARRKYLGRYLEHDDPRMPEVAKGLAAQAVFYRLTGNPFCEREDCRLFNARWQEQLVGSQVNNRRFCNGHSRFLKELKRSESKK